MVLIIQVPSNIDLSAYSFRMQPVVLSCRQIEPQDIFVEIYIDDVDYVLVSPVRFRETQSRVKSDQKQYEA